MRHEDWRARMWAEIERQRGLPFEYGSADCVLFGAAVADAISVGGNYAERARAAFAWSDARTAAGLLSESTLREMVEAVLGPIQPWQRLGAGDLVLCVVDGRELVAVSDGTTPIAKGDRRLDHLRWSDAIGGWRIT